MRAPNRVEKSSQLVQVEQHYSGPLPRPEDLAKYDQIVPGAAERILNMAEREMEHRHNTDNKTTRNIVRVTFWGVIFAFISVLVLSSLVWYALYKGFDSVAATIAVGSIATVAGVFVFFKSKQRK